MYRPTPTSWAFVLAATAITASAAPITGPLTVSDHNPRYFADASGKCVFLTGSHTWESQQDLGPTWPPREFDWEGFLDTVEAHHFNFMRYWMYETARYAPWAGGDYYYTPLPWPRTGPGNASDGKPKFDVSKFNQDYFDRLRERVTAAGEHGIYCAVMLFQGWSISKKSSGGNPWTGHPFNESNNINGLDGDANNNGQGEETHTLNNNNALEYQKAYLVKVINTVNDLDNVLYEIGNESEAGSIAWQSHMVEFIKETESSMPRQHAVGITVPWPGGSNSALFSSPADWISPNSGGGYAGNPPAADGSKVIINDTDHLGLFEATRHWAWSSFLRGLNYVLMDWVDGHVLNGSYSIITEGRKAMEYMQRIATRLDLASVTPRNSLSSTSYCLASEGKQYVAYQPGNGGFDVTLKASTYDCMWLNPVSGDTTAHETITVGDGAHRFNPPFGATAVLYIAEEGFTGIADKPARPSKAAHSGAFGNLRETCFFYDLKGRMLGRSIGGDESRYPAGLAHGVCVYRISGAQVSRQGLAFPHRQGK